MMAERESNRNLVQEKTDQPILSWDIGTAYDLFVSLSVLHTPEEYRLRASWAAGVRSRMPAAERSVVEDTIPLFWVPLTWIYSLPTPKDAASALWALRLISPEERLNALLQGDIEKIEIFNIISRVAERGSWDDKDMEDALTATRGWGMQGRQKIFPKILNWVSKPSEFGEVFLSALQIYYQEFFAEEEKRILPALNAGLERAQKLALNLAWKDLLVDLSQGVHFDDLSGFKELILVPAYWNTPLIYFTKINEERMLVLFGVRPHDAALVPGEIVPDALLTTLKALSDPTRLRILRFLATETLTPAQIARRLRLRAPTVTHHLRELRMAGLVHISLVAEEKKVYAARLERISTLFSSLQSFLKNELLNSDEKNYPS